MPLKDTLWDSQMPLAQVIQEVGKPVDDAVQTKDSNAVEAALWSVWNDLITAAGNTPHAQQDCLVDIVRNIQRKAGPFDSNGQSCNVWDKPVEWEKMSLFGAALREKWNYSPEDPKSSTSGAAEWINLNAFIARITSGYTVSECFDFSLYGLWTLRAALEDEESSTRTVQATLVNAAAMWMMYAGQVMWRKSQIDFEYDGKKARAGETLEDKEWRGFSIERWTTWEDRLKALEKSCGGESHELVDIALTKMDEVARQYKLRHFTTEPDCS
ncbi:MAG: hypothetical protein M1818_005600 [Claussenomyces sp. TS43310]|nr:MAG: hypothetical protein M1818_005600 [Claussenomyces sp. TS43310]